MPAKPIDAAERQLSRALRRLAGLRHVEGDRRELLGADLRVGVDAPAQPRNMLADPAPRLGLRARDVHELALDVRDERRVGARDPFQRLLEDVDCLWRPA